MKQYIVDAFTDKVFSGNPAAVCILDEWLADRLMQNIAIENNFSETAFAVKEGNGYHIRWFTPGGEIDFCGHATLATAYTLFRFYEPDADKLIFNSMVGELVITKNGDLISMVFSAYELKHLEVTEDMISALGEIPLAAYKDRDIMFVMRDEDSVKKLSPDMALLSKLDAVCIAVTARSSEYDCVSRVFAPSMGIDEDPVTGSTHCMIAPYWTKRLSKNELTAFQASKRSGILHIRVNGERVTVSGKAALFAISDILPKL